MEQSMHRVEVIGTGTNSRRRLSSSPTYATSWAKLLRAKQRENLSPYFRYGLRVTFLCIRSSHGPWVIGMIGRREVDDVCESLISEQMDRIITDGN